MRRKRTIDLLKGIAILMILFTHFKWNEEQRHIFIFPWLINMAVPIFMIISGYTGALSIKKHGIDSFFKAYQESELLRKFIRYTVPFVFIVLWQIIDRNVIVGGTGFLGKLQWILNGTTGQGSYYYPILIQLIFLFPVIFFIIERKGREGLWICLVINAAYELLKWSYGMNEACYRLLIFRYIFLIAAGVYASEYEFKMGTAIVMTIVGGLFIGITSYGFYSPRIITA